MNATETLLLPKSIQTLSRVLALGSYLAIAFQISGCFSAYILLSHDSPWDQYNALVRDISGSTAQVVSNPLTMPFMIFLGAGVAANSLVFYHLGRLFWGFAQGEIFTRSSIRRIKWIGYSLGLMGLFVGLGFACIPIIDLIAVPGALFSPVFILVTALVVWVIAFIFEEGRKLNEELSLTV